MFIWLFIISGGLMAIMLGLKHLQEKSEMLFFWPDSREKIDQKLKKSISGLEEKVAKLSKKVSSLIK